MILKEITALIWKDLVIEWRQKYAINGIMLYLASAIFIVYLGFSVNHGIISPDVWITLFWIIILFTAVNAVAKSFILEKEERTLYYFTLASPEAIIISKIIYNSMLMIGLGALGLIFYSTVFQNEIVDKTLFYLSLLLGSVGFAVIFTMISGIASKASNSGALMTILGFPVILPLLLVLIRVSSQALEGAEFEMYKDIAILSSLNILAVATAYILFPYIWRS
jgi:heme exporter protein B